MASLPIPRESVAAGGSFWNAIDFCERAFAALLLILSLPAIFGAAIAIWILSRRSPLIAHRRVGWRGSELWVLKLRTMWDETRSEAGGFHHVEFIEDDEGPGLKGPADARVRHAFARFCRRHSLDELPQLWHVIRGEMALVGPRPATERELRTYYRGVRDEVLFVKPGIAGLWQVSGRSSLSWEERVRLDVEFVRRRTLGMYWRICVGAAWEVWTGANAW